MLLTRTDPLDNQYIPDTVSAPGETLREILEDRQITPAELAEKLGLGYQAVTAIIHGEAPLTHEIALGLEALLGVPAGFWNAYESAYRKSLRRK